MGNLPFDDGNDAFIDLLFAQSLDGFFFMMLDEPVRWNDTVKKDQVLVYVFDHQRLVKANDALLAQYGATRANMRDLTPSRLFAYDLAAGKAIWRQLFDQGKLHITTEACRLDGACIWIKGEYTCLYDGEGRITGHFGIQREVTQSKQTESALYESEEKLETLLESASEGIVVVNQAGAIELINARTEEIFGYSRDELLGQPLSKLVPCEVRSVHGGYCTDFFRDHRKRLMGIGPEQSGERKDGSQVPLEISLSVVDMSEGQLALAFITDITKRVRAEQALKTYTERLEELVEERTAELFQAQAQFLEQRRLQEEVELAARIQASLLPSGAPTLEGFDVCARALPARFVSGDLYEFFLPDPMTCHIVLADVSGKGVPAAMLASSTRTLMRTEMIRDESPAVILDHTNRLFYQDLTHAEQFITLIAARLDIQAGSLHYASAGHTQTLFFQHVRQTLHTLAATGLPIGILEDADFSEEILLLRPGDVVLFYSDGIIETFNREGEFFGVDRLAQLVLDHAHETAERIVQRIVEAVEMFQGDGHRSDDVTLIALKAQPRTITFAYPAHLDHLNTVTSLIRTVATPYGSDFAYQMELVISEILTNVIQHAYSETSGEVRGEIHLAPDGVTVDLYDDGNSFDPASVPQPSPGELQVGGYGLFIAQQLTDELVYVPGSPQGNHWHLSKSAEGESSER